MSRSFLIVVTALASTAAIACGSPSPTNGSAAQAVGGNDCAPDGTDCKPAPTPGQPPSPPVDACYVAEFSGSICLGADTWKQLASIACGAGGATLTSVTPSGYCNGPTPKQPGVPTTPDDKNGDPSNTGSPTPSDELPGGASTGAKFTCCIATQPPTPPNPCIKIPYDSTNAGNDAAALVCRDKGLVFNGSDSTDPSGQNGGSFFRCCPPPPPPPPATCNTIYVGDKQTCLSKDQIELKAAAACAQQNLLVSTINMTPCNDGASPNGQSDGGLLAEVVCCGGGPTTEPQPQSDQKP